MNERYSKLAFLHRVKERKTPSLSAQASFALFSLKVAWSGKSLNYDDHTEYAMNSGHFCYGKTHLGLY